MKEWETEKTESVQAVLDGFRGVWERVEGTQATAPCPEREPAAHACPENERMESCEDSLRALVETAADSAMYDRTLACRCRGASRTMLQEHAAQAAHRASCLRGEYFVRCGVRHRPKDSCPRMGDALTALRDGMLRDLASAEAYRRAAGSTDDKELRERLERFACEVESAAAEKRRMILRSFQ